MSESTESFGSVVARGWASRPVRIAKTTAVVAGVVTTVVVVQGVTTYALSSLGEAVCESIAGVFAG